MPTKKAIKKNKEEQLGDKIMELCTKFTQEYLALFDPKDLTPKRLINLALSGPAIFSYNVIKCLMRMFEITETDGITTKAIEWQELLIKQTIMQLTRAFGIKELSVFEIDKMYEQAITDWADEVAKIQQ